MTKKPFYLKGVVEGQNSLLFETPEGTIFYEKLANTIHFGKKEKLSGLQKEVESVKYSPFFESDSLKNLKGKELEGLLLNVTERCNFSCTYCIYSGNYINERKNNSKDMDFETAKKAVDLFIPKSEKRALIAFYGGEPLENMNLIKKVIKYSKEKYPQKEIVFSMTTNFYNGDKHLQDIVDNRLYLNISLDGPKEIHDKFRKHKNKGPTWDKIVDNLNKLEESSPGYIESHVGMSTSCADSKDFNRIMNYFLENEQFKVIRIGGIEQKGLNDFSKERNSLEVTEAIQKYINILSLGKIPPGILRNIFDQKLKVLSNRNKEKMPEKLMLNGSCYPGNRKLFVDTSGEFYMCEKFGRRAPIGDINNGLREDLVESYIDGFKDIRNSLCKECWAQRICNPCIQSAKDPNGELSLEGLSETCNNSKSEILFNLSIYTTLLNTNKEFFEKYLETIQNN